MSARSAARLWSSLLALVLACDRSETDESTSTTEPAPPVRIPPKLDTPCEVDGEFICDEQGDAQSCQDGVWTRVYCSATCKSIDPPQCSLGCLITSAGDRCLCADLGGVCD